MLMIAHLFAPPRGGKRLCFGPFWCLHEVARFAVLPPRSTAGLERMCGTSVLPQSGPRHAARLGVVVHHSTGPCLLRWDPRVSTEQRAFCCGK